MTVYYILNDANETVGVDDVITWGEWMAKNDRRKIVKQETVEARWVSTVFLGLDHNWGDGKPALFETMIFSNGDRTDLYCDRYATWNEALDGHAKAVAMVKANPTMETYYEAL